MVAIPLTGWITRALSTRGAFTVCVLGFTVSSAACAGGSGFWWLVAARVVHGFFGGFLIPLVFSAVFLMFGAGPARARGTTIAGVMAMLAPTLGPTVGGFITERFSWHWLFLINVPVGIVVAGVVAWSVSIDRAEGREGGGIDLAAAPLLAVFLAGLQVVLSEAPTQGWSSPVMLATMLLCLCSGAITVRRCLAHPAPLVHLSAFRRRNFVLGCVFSFALGAGLYGATFLLPLFLGVVRHHDPFEIGLIMTVTGGAQLIAAPIATLLERRSDPRLLTVCGYGLLSIGLIGNGFLQPSDDFWGLAWQQATRGMAFMFCLLPTTSLALGAFPPADVANASGLFNLMRNLGGAIGLAAIDTLIQQRVPIHTATLVERLQAGDPQTAQFVGLPLDQFTGQPVDQATRDLVAPLVEHAGLTLALNEAWLLLGGVVLLSVIAAPFLRRQETNGGLE